MANFENRADIVGTFDSKSVAGTTITAVETANIPLVKTATPSFWIGGDLLFTITIDNQEATSFTGLTITDMLNLTYMQFVPGSVIINGQPGILGTNYTYDAGEGKLVVTIDEVSAGSQAVISFRVLRA